MKKKIGMLILLILSCRVLAGTSDYYDFKWLDPSKQVYVLQDKIYENKKSFHLRVGYLNQGLSDFQDTSGFNIGANYFFTEQIGLEALYSSYSNKNNDSYSAVLNGRVSVLPFIVKIDSAASLLLMYSPFYAKLNTYNIISYVHWSFSGGFAQLKVQDNYLAFTNQNNQNNTVIVADSYEAASKTALVAKTQVQFILGPLVSVNFDYLNYWAKLRQPSTGGNEKFVRFSDYIFSVGFRFQ